MPGAAQRRAPRRPQRRRGRTAPPRAARLLGSSSCSSLTSDVRRGAHTYRRGRRGTGRHYAASACSTFRYRGAHSRCPSRQHAVLSRARTTTPASASSIAASVAASRRDARGGRVLVELLGPRAPTIAEATFGSRSTHARASWASVRPAAAAIGRRRSTAARTSSRRGSGPSPSPSVSDAARESGRIRRAGPVLARSARPGASGDHTICEIPSAAQSGITARSGSAPEQRVLRLARDEPLHAGQRVGGLDLRRPSTR